MQGNSENPKNRMGAIIAIIIVIILLLVFMPQLTKIAEYVATSFGFSKVAKDDEAYLIPDEDAKQEHMNGDNSMGMGIRNGVVTPESAELMKIMGYGDNVTWDEVLKTTELDPATFANHQDFVKDVRRFSSGANFTSVTDDNTNSAFTNFVGLRRPQQVDIGASARQQPDIDQSVLKRNEPLRWGYSAGGGTYLTAEQNNVPAGQYQYENNVQSAENFVNW